MDRHHGWTLSAKPLFIGLVLSLLLGGAAVFLSTERFAAIQTALLVLAAAQAAVQLVFFMHLGIEEKPRWNLITFWLLATMVFIIVAGSIWIMYHLDYNVMPDMVH